MLLLLSLLVLLLFFIRNQIPVPPHAQCICNHAGLEVVRDTIREACQLQVLPGSCENRALYYIILPHIMLHYTVLYYIVYYRLLCYRNTVLYYTILIYLYTCQTERFSGSPAPACRRDSSQQCPAQGRSRTEHIILHSIYYIVYII